MSKPDPCFTVRYSGRKDLFEGPNAACLVSFYATTETAARERVEAAGYTVSAVEVADIPTRMLVDGSRDGLCPVGAI